MPSVFTLESIPEAPPLTDDAHYDKAMDCSAVAKISHLVAQSGE